MSSDDEAAEHHSKRDRLKGAFSRTRQKIEKHAAEKLKEHTENRRRRKDEEDITPLSNDVADFLAAGRTSASSHRPSNDSTQHTDTSPRPSSSESANVNSSQPLPLRVPVPRLDVSGSQRFPGAQTHGGQQPVGAEYLQPKPYVRSQSASATSLERKERIRGLSVGFSNTAPVIIGEGGDDAEAPPAEIGRAKARSRSMSPMGIKPNVKHTQDLSPIHSAISPHAPTMADMWEPKPFKRVATSGLTNTEQVIQPQPAPNIRNGTPVQETEFVPRTIKRNLTGLDKEFQMSLGATKPGAPGSLTGPSAPLHQPKPQRPPPSYNVIEQGPSPLPTSPPPVSPQPQQRVENASGYTSTPQRGPSLSSHPFRQVEARPPLQEVRSPPPDMDRVVPREPTLPQLDRDGDELGTPYSFHSFDSSITPHDRDTIRHGNGPIPAIGQTAVASYFAPIQPQRHDLSGPQHHTVQSPSFYPSQPSPASQSDVMSQQPQQQTIPRKPLPSPERNFPDSRPILPTRASSNTHKMTSRPIPQPRRQHTFAEQTTGVMSGAGGYFPTSISTDSPGEQHALRRKQNISQLRQPQNRPDYSGDAYDGYEEFNPNAAIVSGVPVSTMAPPRHPAERYYENSGMDSTIYDR